MKNILKLVVLLLVASLAMVGCNENEIGKYLDQYSQTDNTVKDVELNMYVITDDVTSANAKTTVNSMIASYTLNTYHTEVNVQFLSEENYETEILKYVNSTKEDAANIIMINSASLMNKLSASGNLVNLYGYLNTDTYGTLNVSVEKLLSAAEVNDNDETSVYAIPNNHEIGEYEYLVIDEEIAKQTLKYSPTVLSSFDTYEKTADLRADIENELGLDADNYVQIQKGSYSLKAQLEATGKVCNVISYPVANAEEAFSGAFSIVNRGEESNDRAMQIIYALNKDVQLRNYLQYGVVGTNYTLDSNSGKVILVNSPENIYRMNLQYTGDVFTAYYCDEYNWTQEMANNVSKQNEQAIVATLGADE